MTRPKKNRSAEPVSSQPRADYPVGYGRPPQNTRFRPGVSGNRKGRPLGSSTRFTPDRTKKVFLAELARLTLVEEGTDILQMSMGRLLIRNLFHLASSGDLAALKFVLEHAKHLEDEAENDHQEAHAALLKYKLEMSALIAQRKSKGLDVSHIVPDPDHILIMGDGTFQIRGPATRSEKQMYDELRVEMKKLKETLSRIDAALPNAEGANKDYLLAAQERFRRPLKEWESFRPDWWAECYPDAP